MVRISLVYVLVNFSATFSCYKVLGGLIWKKVVVPLRRLLPLRKVSISSFDIKEQLTEMLQNVNEANKERSRIAAVSSVCVTQPNIMV